MRTRLPVAALCCFLMALCGMWPAIAAFNRPASVAGLPLLMSWSFLLAIGVAVALWICDVRGVR